MLRVMNWGIHWFRRDLRVAGNPALQWNWKANQGRVVGIFCFDSKFLSRSDFSHHRFAFFLETLRVLRDELASIGSDLWVIDNLPLTAFPILFDSFKKKSLTLPQISYNRDYEPFARDRDTLVSNLLENEIGAKVHVERDHLLIEPTEILKPDNSSFYQIYTPYSRRWLDHFKTKEIQSRLETQKKGLLYLESKIGGNSSSDLFQLRWRDIYGDQTQPFKDSLEEWIEKNKSKLTIQIPAAGSMEGLKRLNLFKDRLSEYEENRDIPKLDGTSKLSIFLKNGSLTTAQVIIALGLERTALQPYLRWPKGPETSSPHLVPKVSKRHMEEAIVNAGRVIPERAEGKIKYLKELIWREFYYSILYHKPNVENSAFLDQYQNLNWENDEEKFAAWKTGMTGYPIVDAGMRQLQQEGWMHNRVRMIVASFLTKDLLIDWRWGENHFMKELLDGDLAPNNGGWQWAASTGCDPQPYFRIFNPKLQSEKFDPQGEYIRRYVPQLAGLSSKHIHAPHLLGEGTLKKLNYPAPIVDHASQKFRVLKLYETAKSKFKAKD